MTPTPWCTPKAFERVAVNQVFLKFRLSSSRVLMSVALRIVAFRPLTSKNHVNQIASLRNKIHKNHGSKITQQIYTRGFNQKTTDYVLSIVLKLQVK